MAGKGTTKSKPFSAAERQRALEVIAKCDGSLTKAALRLGISIPTLSQWRKATQGARPLPSGSIHRRQRR